MIRPMDSIDIRVGTEEDTHAIIQFALTLSEDPFTSRDQWQKTLQQPGVYPLVAVFQHNIVGKLQAQVLGNYGWLEAARVSPDFRNMGLAHTLVDSAMDWLIHQGVTIIRTVVDSDNMAARKILERHHFSPTFLSINPSARVVEDDSDPMLTADFAPVLDEELYNHYAIMLKEHTAGNIMLDGHYLPFTKELMQQLIEQRRMYTTSDDSTLLIVSQHNLPAEVHGFLVAADIPHYLRGAKALKGFAAREMATLAICHAPSRREAVIGLAQRGFAWNQPHTIIIYDRDSWQERTESEE